MLFIPTILSESPYLVNLSLLGWAGWIGLFAIEIFLLYKFRKQNKSFSNQRLTTFLILLLFVPVTSLFLGIQFQTGEAPPFPNLPANLPGPVAMIFSAIPWVLAAGLLGPLPSAILGALTGLIQGIWGTHNVFTILQFSLLATLFSYAIHQPFRTPVFRYLRRPLVSTTILLILSPAFYFYQFLFYSTHGSIPQIELIYYLLITSMLALGIVLFIGGLFGEAIAISYPKNWISIETKIPSPAERSLEKRFFVYLAPLILLLALAGMVFTWIIATKTARNLVEEQVENNSTLAAKNIPLFIQNGQQQIQMIAQEANLANTPREQQIEYLRVKVTNSAFFDQLTLLDTQGQVIAGYPLENYDELSPTLEERRGIQYALKGIPVQTYPAVPGEAKNTADLSFISPVFTGDRKLFGVMVGRANLGSNPYSQVIIQNLNDSAGKDGQGVLVDENGTILVHPNLSLIMTPYQGTLSPNAEFSSTVGPDGVRRIIFKQPVQGYGWSVITSFPASRMQALSIQIAAPICLAILIISLMVLLTMQIGLRQVTSSLRSLTYEADRISQGKLEQPLELDGEDEIGDLRKSFEKMRLSLKSRLDELNRLLVVSQGVASSLDVEEALQPVLSAALTTGAISARVVLAPSIIPELETATNRPTRIAQGPEKDKYAYLDEQILAINHRQFQLVLVNASQQKILNFPAGRAKPGSLLAFGLHHEKMYYGSFWIAFENNHRFTSEEVRYMATLASQAVLAAVNARLFMNAEVGRQRFSAILASSPDPILVTDQHSHLLVANPAAIHLFGIDIQKHYQLPIHQVLDQEEVISLLQGQRKSKDTIQLQLPGGEVYMTTASPILAEGNLKGRVCILRDVTHFKQLDELKSEFVATVSHDLRSPLTLMRGYATMLEMVGTLNEQQTGYVRKIISGVENMTHLVSSLLDLGRIETGIGLQLEEVSLQSILERVIDSQKIHATQKQIQLTGEVAPGVQEFIEADPALLQQALTNLVENALKFTRPNGKVRIQILQENDQVLFEVIDNGIGIPPLDQPRLFEKFYRGMHWNEKESRGTGLGLSIVKSITERHSGHVSVDSQLGKGSKFTITIPVRQKKPEITR
jgi:PAS domain S-box-containing protein